MNDLIYKCEICGILLKSNKSRSQHVQKAHNIQPKDYYDRFLKKDGEGFCKTCKTEIQWKPGKRYSRYCSASCAMKDPEIQKHINNKETNEIRSQKYKNKSREDIEKESQKRIVTNLERYGKKGHGRNPVDLTISKPELFDVNKPFKCQLCNRTFDHRNGLSNHIKKHNISFIEYYDKYLKKDGENICKVCGTKTNFNKGSYNIYCSIKCSTNDNTEKITESLKKLYIGNDELRRKISLGVKESCKTRTQEDIDRANNKRKQTCLNLYGETNISKLENIQEKKIINSLKSKKYIMPSGKIIYVKGYEDKFLDYIFNNKLCTEDEIVVYPHSIKYIDEHGTWRLYFPDFYIPKWNLIVEVKSTYVIKHYQGEENFKLKEVFTIISGFNYISIIDNNFDSFIEIVNKNQPIKNLAGSESTKP